MKNVLACAALAAGLVLSAPALADDRSSDPDVAAKATPAKKSVRIRVLRGEPSGDTDKALAKVRGLKQGKLARWKWRIAKKLSRQFTVGDSHVITLPNGGKVKVSVTRELSAAGFFGFTFGLSYMKPRGTTFKDAGTYTLKSGDPDGAIFGTDGFFDGRGGSLGATVGWDSGGEDSGHDGHGGKY